MCNLYSMTKAPAAIGSLFRVPHNRQEQFDLLPAIFPGWSAPVVRRASDGERELIMMSWGFVLLQDGKAPRRVTNTRDDKVQSRFWRASIEQRRCLVPATSFCEPHDGRKPATWHWFALSGDEPRPPFAFAGIWQRWKGPDQKGRREYRAGRLQLHDDRAEFGNIGHQSRAVTGPAYYRRAAGYVAARHDRRSSCASPSDFRRPLADSARRLREEEFNGNSLSQLSMRMKKETHP